MIIGCALVVDELNKGPRLVIRYPESIPSSILNLNNNALLKYHNDYLNISPENFAKLFRPKLALCNKVLELCIDDLEYTSYACNSNVVSTVTLFNIIVVKVRDNALLKSFQSSSIRSMSNVSRRLHQNSSHSSTSNLMVAMMGLDSNLNFVSSSEIRKYVYILRLYYFHFMILLS